MSVYKKIYAVDFDGTLAETKFPEIIAPIQSMFNICKDIKEGGDILILWTCRCGEDLVAAVEFCRENGLEFDYINENVPENVEHWGNDSRKIFAHAYIDDKAVIPQRTLADEGFMLNEAWRRLKREVKQTLKAKGRKNNGKKRIMQILRAAKNRRERRRNDRTAAGRMRDTSL